MVDIKQQSGYIALIAVLIVGAVASSVAFTVLSSGIDRLNGTQDGQQSIQAAALATSCAEEALQVIHDNNAYVGTATVNLGQGSCTYTVTSTAINTRTITTTATVNSIVRKIQVYVTIGTTSISVTSWQEVS